MFMNKREQNPPVFLTVNSPCVPNNIILRLDFNF